MKEIDVEDIDGDIPQKDKKEYIRILLSGKEGAGKTSIKSLIFENKLPKETLNIAKTKELEISRFKFLKNIYIEVIDYPGNDTKLLETKKEKIFSKINIFIYVIDSGNIEENSSNFNK